MARFELTGLHEVDGVAPGGEIEVPDEATARRLAKRGAISWDAFAAAYLEPKKKPATPAKRKGDK